MDRFCVRQRLARERGICIVCHATKTPPDRAVCEVCNDKAKTRVQKRRAAVRLAALGAESSGDSALARYCYSDAIRFYKAASEGAHSSVEGARLALKLGSAVFEAGFVLDARIHYERALELYNANRQNDGRAIAYLRLARQCWVEARMMQALTHIEQALFILRQSPRTSLLHHALIIKASYLTSMERYDDADAVARYVGQFEKTFNGESLTAHLRTKGAIYTAKGKLHEACAAFDAATTVASESHSGSAGGVWSEYAYAALALGLTDRAIAYVQRSILVAREYKASHEIAYNMLEYSYFLALVGRMEQAKRVLCDSLSYNCDTPMLQILSCGYGIPIAIQCGDEDLLKRLETTKSLNTAFASGDAYSISLVANAFGELYLHHGDTDKAIATVQRGLDSIEWFDYNWDLLFLAMRCCQSQTTRSRVFGIVTERAKRPNARVAMAAMALCHCLASEKDGDELAASRYAREAVTRFSELNWARYAESAATVLRRVERGRGVEKSAFGSLEYMVSLSGLGSLTKRENQVARLVLNGESNRDIASALSISEHTVEKHMSSILNRLGIRSRWQLTKALDVERKR